MTADEFDLEQFLPYRLNRAVEFVSLRFAAHYNAAYDLTRPEWRTLAALGSRGCMTATEIGAHSAMHKTKVSRAVFNLEQRRWLKRQADPGDRRVEHLELTPTGRRYYLELTGVARTYEKELLDLVGEKGLQALAQGLSAVEDAMKQHPAAGKKSVAEC